jgi:acetyl esterase/lipase
MQMPIGYLVTAGLIATLALSAAAGHRPRHSSPFRLSYVFGLVLNWPIFAFVLLVASTALAFRQSGAGLGFWIGFGLTVLASAGLAVLRQRARRTGPVLERALGEGLGTDWRESVNAELVGRLRRRPSLVRVLLAPIASRRHGVRRIANIRYGPAHRANLLDVYRDRSDRLGRPTLIYFHGGGLRFGSKRLGARHLLHRLAGRGWVCVSANYRLRLGDGSADPLVDVKKVIAWVREHARDYGVDADTVFIAGSSAGGHLASRAAFTDASIAGVISLYGYYGEIAVDAPPSARLEYETTNAPPYFVAHGDQDTLVIVEDARGFVQQLRSTSSNPVVYAELPGAQHGFDLFRSRRFDSLVDAIEVFTVHVRSRRRAAEPALGPRDESARPAPTAERWR